jgi:hypothetical protein
MDPQRWEKIESLYHTALAVAPADRSAYLTDACEDSGLRREIESLLAYSEANLESPIALSKRLPSGFRLGFYEIKALLGVGGMGEVYRACDTKLKRDVALKVLPAEFARDPDRAARFQREAQLLASLNHPHIATLHGLEQSDGTTALVMELVDGPTLAQRIAQGPIPPPEAFEIARQIAEALEYAHERGVIHRDLKPANVKLTPDDKVKLLDFGLAKALEDDAGPEASQDSPTLTLGHTRAGVILGTAGYMAPEQVMGKRADRRADIWAFGVVLYEMLTGKRLFTGKNTAEILASVVKDQLSLEGVPVGVRPMLARCLEKDRRRRLQAIGEARIQIEDGFPEAAPTAVPVPIPPRPWWAKLGSWAALAGMGVLAGGAIGFVHFREAQPELHRVQFEIVPPGAFQSAPVLSPDGRHVAFVARGPNRTAGLWVRSLDSISARVFPGTEVAAPLAPFWSPDSRSLGFVSGVDGTLKRIDIAGGAPQTICGLRGGVAAFGGGTWSADGTIIFAAGQSLWWVPQAGGTPAPLTQATEGEQVDPVDPHFMPDGKHFVYRERASVSVGSTIYLAALANQQRTKLPTGDSIGAGVAYSPPLTKGDSGHLLFIRPR